MPDTTHHVRVLVVRHGPAETRDPRRWPNDALRPLSAKGLVQTRRVARRLGRMCGTVAHVASSSAVRARRTAELVGAALEPPRRVELWPELESDRSASPIFARLTRTVRSNQQMILVGHEPTLAEFVGIALTGEGVAITHLSKGGAAALEFPSTVRPGAARLLWLLTRKQLA
jgi:phosphohistidine phosphatase SixA